LADYFTLALARVVESRVKDSRFVAWISPADSREQAEKLIAQRSRDFAGATHHCFALRLGMGDQLVARSSDAGEPAGSAGRPILQALEARRVTNIAAVVSRYFGGTKLGVGGLIRAYGGATFAALDAATLHPFFAACKLQLRYQYPDSAAVEKVLHKFSAVTLAESFGTIVQRRVLVRQTEEAAFRMMLQDLSAGRIWITELHDESENERP